MLTAQKLSIRERSRGVKRFYIPCKRILANSSCGLPVTENLCRQVQAKMGKIHFSAELKKLKNIF